MWSLRLLILKLDYLKGIVILSLRFTVFMIVRNFAKLLFLKCKIIIIISQ